MPVIIIIVVSLLILKPIISRQRAAPPRYSQPHFNTTVPIPINTETQKEIDRRRKEDERIQKQIEKDAKRAEEKRAATDKINWLDSMIYRYSDLYEQIENELSSNPGLKQYKIIQLEKQLLQIEEKIRKYHEQRDKAYFIANS